VKVETAPLRRVYRCSSPGGHPGFFFRHSGYPLIRYDRDGDGIEKLRGRVRPPKLPSLGDSGESDKRAGCFGIRIWAALVSGFGGAPWRAS